MVADTTSAAVEKPTGMAFEANYKEYNEEDSDAGAEHNPTINSVVYRSFDICATVHF